MEKNKLDGSTQNNYVSKVNLLEQEIIDLKNQNKARMIRMGEETQLDINEGDFNKRIDLIVEEINQIWSFTQRFIDEHAIDMIQEVGTPDRSIRDKMNRMDWLARNADFLSPDQITKCLLAFKDQFNGGSVQARQAYITAAHTSNAVITVINLIDHSSKLQRDEENISRLAILLSILEPLLINDANLERTIETSCLDLLIELLKLPDNFNDEQLVNGSQNS